MTIDRSTFFTSTSRAIIWALLLIAAAVAVFHSLSATKNLIADDECAKRFPLTNKALDCATYDAASEDMAALDQSLEDTAAKYMNKEEANSVSIWVRDLSTMQWASANENIRYSPSSLMKVPLMIAYFKFAQIDPSILTQNVLYDSSDASLDAGQNFPPETLLQSGKSYPISQLIEEMIVHSDNHAAAVLLMHMNPDFFKQTLIDLGIQIPKDGKTYDFITVKTYAGLFRVLYNASYLNREYSEKALELLKATTFKGLAKELPKDTVVADKFGEHEEDNPDGSVIEKELHDCGIVYKEDRIYSICIMTEGKDFKPLEGIISDVSKLVYDNI